MVMDSSWSAGDLTFEQWIGIVNDELPIDLRSTDLMRRKWEKHPRRVTAFDLGSEHNAHVQVWDDSVDMATVRGLPHEKMHPPAKYYPRFRLDAQRAAADIARFLNVGDLPKYP
jgi:hypothetical protein